jgi:hypothetical protein
MSDSTDIPDFETLAADAEISPLLDFEPVPRQVPRPNGWTPDRQREFIARLAHFGSPKLAADSMGKNVSGVAALYKQKGAESFRAAWDAAQALGISRRPPDTGAVFLGTPPGMSPRRAENRLAEQDPQPGHVLNEFGEWEDEGALQSRAEAARDSVSNKLLQARRLYLQEISGSAGKRAAFEILTELPVDWERAERLEPQPDEPWRKPNMRRPDMLLTAENGWLGNVAHGPDKKAELRQAIDEHRSAEGLPPVEWDGDEQGGTATGAEG